MRMKCDVCGLEALGNQTFSREAIPFCKTKTYCHNCYARLYRRVFQLILAITLVMGGVGIILLWRAPTSSTGRLWLNLFLLQAFVIATILPHELGHAFMGAWLAFRFQR